MNLEKEMLTNEIVNSTTVQQANGRTRSKSRPAGVGAPLRALVSLGAGRRNAGESFFLSNVPRPACGISARVRH